jgi:hypothetical protein
MTSFDTNGLLLPEHQTDAINIGAVVARVREEADADQAELADLRSSNQRLRVENLALRTKIERLKSSRSLERYLMIGGMAFLWFAFIAFVMHKLIAFSS